MPCAERFLLPSLTVRGQNLLMNECEFTNSGEGKNKLYLFSQHAPALLSLSFRKQIQRFKRLNVSREKVYTKISTPPHFLQGGIHVSLSLRERARVRGLHENKTKNKLSTVVFIFSTRSRPAHAIVSKTNTTLQI